MVRTCHEERPAVCRKKDDGNGVRDRNGKRKRGRPKKIFLDVVKKDMRELGARKKNIRNRRLWRNMIRC